MKEAETKKNKARRILKSHRGKLGSIANISIKEIQKSRIFLLKARNNKFCGVGGVHIPRRLETTSETKFHYQDAYREALKI